MTEKDTAAGSEKNEIVVYQPEGGEFHIETKIYRESVWLTQIQIAELFGTRRQAITKHLINIFHDKELDENAVSSKMELTAADGKNYLTKFYNLDAILSIGYRVNSIRATQFRRWANQILKDHLLRGYSVNQRLVSHENKLDKLDSRVLNLEKQVDFFVKATLPPTEGAIPAKSWWSGYEFAAQIVRSASKEVVIIDPYADDVALRLIAKRAPGINAIVYSARISRTMKEEVSLMNKQQPKVDLLPMQNVHDRFIIVDDTIYHIGASIKDLGNKLTAFSVLNLLTKEQLLGMVK